MFHKVSAACEKSSIIPLICTEKQVWHFAYDRLVLVEVDLLFALFNYTKSQIQSMYLTQTHPVLTVPISHFFSELLVFGYAIAKSIH